MHIMLYSEMYFALRRELAAVYADAADVAETDGCVFL